MPGAGTVKGAQSDPNYVSRLGLGPVANICRGPKNCSYATVTFSIEFIKKLKLTRNLIVCLYVLALQLWISHKVTYGNMSYVLIKCDSSQSKFLFLKHI